MISIGFGGGETLLVDAPLGMIRASKHHHALTFWLVIALGLLNLAFCAAWLDERAALRRLRAGSPFEAWLQERLDAAKMIRRQRLGMGDAWFKRSVGDWETANVMAMAGVDKAGQSTGDGLAPDLVQSYRTNQATGQIGIPPPRGVTEYERELERQVAWMKRTLRDLQADSFRRRRAALLALLPTVTRGRSES